MKRNLQKYYMWAKRAQRDSDSDSADGDALTDDSASENNKLCLQVGTSREDTPDTFEPQPGCSKQYDTIIAPSESSSTDTDIEFNKYLADSENDNLVENYNIGHDNDARLSFKSRLAEWAVKYNIPNTATNELLKLLQSEVRTPLPLDARTLLSTVRRIELKDIAPGQYYHFGLKQAVSNLINCASAARAEQIDLYVNIDGLPLAKSSTSQVYPILISIAGENTVEMVGIYHGNQKPSNPNDFLHDFVEDTINMVNNGLEINTRHFQIKIKGFICDAPAKSFIKLIKGHTGYSSCTKCDVQGTFSDRIYFPDIENLHLRTDEEFRAQVDDDHHLGKTILDNIPGLDMINGFPLDYMHLVCLGVMKKLLNLLCNGKPSTKIPYIKISNISTLLVFLSENIPLEFNRKPRSLTELQRWKATEFRQFLLYTGPLVLKKNLNPDRYINFLTLHVAITILTSSKLKNLINYAHELLKYFVKTFQDLYGVNHTSHNIHNLLHLTKDVYNHGSLDKFSAFPYENFLQSILKTLRKNEKPLQQIVKRHSEKSAVQKQPKIIFPMFQDEHKNGPCPHHFDNSVEQFKTVTFSNFTLKISPPNNCCGLKNNDVIVINNIIKTEDSFYLVGRKYTSKSSFYDSPCDSLELNIFKTQESSLGDVETFNGANIAYKCNAFKFEDSIIVMPLVHC